MSDKEPRMNLKELRDLLNKLPEKNLEKYALATDLCLEEPEGKFGIIFLAGEDEWEELRGFYDLPEYDEINERLLKLLNSDVSKIVRFKFDDEDVCEEMQDTDW